MYSLVSLKIDDNVFAAHDLGNNNRSTGQNATNRYGYAYDLTEVGVILDDCYSAFHCRL